MKSKRIIYTVLLIVWMMVIFMFSNQDAVKSESTSDKVASSIIDTISTVTNNEVPEEKKTIMIEDTRVLVRKTAHFTAFFILGIIAYLMFKSYSVSKPLLYAVVFCLLYACSDEIHQMFLDGRTARILDVSIDTMGSLVGSLLVSRFKRDK